MSFCQLREEKEVFSYNFTMHSEIAYIEKALRARYNEIVLIRKHYKIYVNEKTRKMQMCRKMGLLLMSHGNFAQEIMNSAELIIGKQSNYGVLGVHIEDQIEDLKLKMQQQLGKLDLSKGLVVFTDIIGGTPMNLAGNLLIDNNVLICSGLNMPLLLEFLFNREKSIKELQQILKATYMNGMTMRTNEIYGKVEDEDDMFL